LFSLFSVALASVGNTQLKAAYNAAQNELLLDGYAGYKELLPTYLVPGWTRCGECLPVEGAYPWPKKSDAVGVFAHILESGVIRGAFPGDVREEDPDLFQFSTRIVEIIGEYYGIDLELELESFENSAACFNAVKDGDADFLLPNFSFGAFVDHVPRTAGWQPSCATSCGVSVFLVRADRNTADYADFVSSLQAGEKIGADGAGSLAEAQALFPEDAEIVLYDNVEEELIADFNSGKLVAAYGISTTVMNGLNFPYTVVFTEALSVAGAFFALDDAPECEAEEPAEIQTQINFNFNGMIPSKF